MKSKFKKSYLLGLVPVLFGTALFSSSCFENSSTEEPVNFPNESNVSVTFNDENINIEDIQNEDCKFIFLDLINKFKYEIIMQKIVSKDPANYSIILSWRLKDKKTGQVSQTFQKSFPYGRINKVAKECELKIDESKFTNLYASNIEKSDILPLNLDNNYALEIEEIEADDTNGTLKIIYHIIDKTTNRISSSYLKEFSNFKVNIDKLAKHVKFTLKSNISKIDTKPSEIQKDYIVPFDFDKEVYDIDIYNLVPDDNSGTLTFKYVLTNKNNSLIKSNELTGQIKHLKTSQGSKLSELAEILKLIQFKLKNKVAKTIFASSVTAEDLKADNYNYIDYDYKIINLVADNNTGILKIDFKLTHARTNESMESTYTISGFKSKNSSNPSVSPKVRLKLAHWNVCNFGAAALPNGSNRKKKGEAIASVIYKQGIDICGLTELDSSDVAPALVKMLNEIETKEKTGNVWNYVTGDYSRSMGISISQAAHGDSNADYLYKSNLVRPVVTKGKEGLFYDSKNFENKFGGNRNEYTRTPFCVKFELLNNVITNKDFVFGISHFDGPGVKSGEVSAKVGGGVGSFEANEAYNIPNVFKWMEKTFNDNDFVFQGDTNIPNGKWSSVFSPKNGEQSLLADNDENASSLKKTQFEYAQPYDKIVLKSSLNYSNAGIYKLWDFVKDNTYYWEKINNYNDWFNYCSNYGDVPASNGAVYGYISDHCPIFFDLHFEN